jgi:hypothetical protein
MIVAAKLSCWRRKVFSNTFIEQGEYVCWHFKVVTVKSHQPFLTQHSLVSVFPITKDGCHDFKTCGSTVWSCRVVQSRPGLVLLRWKFPFRRLISSLACSLVILMLAVAVALRHRTSREAVLDEDNVPATAVDEELARQCEHGTKTPADFVIHMSIQNSKDLADNDSVGNVTSFHPNAVIECTLFDTKFRSKMKQDSTV